MQSYVVGKEQCPACSSQGKDTSRDNFAIFSDGHKFCFSCKYTQFPSGVSRFKSKEEVVPEQKELVYLPVDCDIVYPERALTWIEQYGLDRKDLLNHNVMWSDSLQRLIFPVFGEQGNLIAWQGRSFSLDQSVLTHKKIPKWFGKGNLRDTFYIVGKGKQLILTEDIISAIKVSKCGVMAMPLFGCVIGRERFKRLFSLYKDKVEVRVWLDCDKSKEATIEAKLGRICGLNCSSILGDKDPKEYSWREIEEILK